MKTVRSNPLENLVMKTSDFSRFDTLASSGTKRDTVLRSNNIFGKRLLDVSDKDSYHLTETKKQQLAIYLNQSRKDSSIAKSINATFDKIINDYLIPYLIFSNAPIGQFAVDESALEILWLVDGNSLYWRVEDDDSVAIWFDNSDGEELFSYDFSHLDNINRQAISASVEALQLMSKNVKYNIHYVLGSI